MGKTCKKEKGFNWQARKVVHTYIDNTSTSKIKLDLKEASGARYDECNALVIPSEKRSTRKKKEAMTVTRVLSKRHRKRLEKVVEQKNKKENRASLLAALSKVQAPAEMLQHLTSIAAMQTLGLKRHFLDARSTEQAQARGRDNDNTRSMEHTPASGRDSDATETRVNSIAGSRKRRRLLAGRGGGEGKERRGDDPNVLGFEISSDSSGEESDDSTTTPEGLEPEGRRKQTCEEEQTLPIEQQTDEPVRQEVVATVEETTKVIEKTKSEETIKVKEKTTSEETAKVKEKTPSEETAKVKEKTTSEETAKVKEKTTGEETAKVKEKTPSEETTKVKEKTPSEETAKVKEKTTSVETEVKAAVFVPVQRTKAMQAARMKLPILAEEQGIMEAINDNAVVVIAGETGSGKTTQLPQFLYEAGYASGGQMIGVTEPRRVAAISMAARVAAEMNLSSRQVSYLIRFEGNVTDDTRIKFMTDGVLLKEIQSDFLLARYSVLILDEGHERSVYTDILAGLLSRIVPLRAKRGRPLKLIIMSATLRLEDFTDNPRLFKTPPPVVKVESRQYPVTIHFNKRTSDEYLSEAYKKASKIHTQLPEGGILVFLTGQQEVNSLVRKLRRSFPASGKHSALVGDEDVEEQMTQALRHRRRKRKQPIELPNVDLDNFTVMPNDDTEMDMLEVDDNDDDEDDDAIMADDDANTVTRIPGGQPMWVLPLYSLLPSSAQAKVFAGCPAGSRLVVVSTNVAETSLTIPGIKYVVDCGRVKSRVYDKATGVSAFKVSWCSKAGANQRAGRAGRTAAGHCYRLYSSAVFNDEFEDFTMPEIQRKPVDDLMLQMKAMNIVKVVNFPFPSPPDATQLQSAERRLQLLGALITPAKHEDEWSSRISPLGIAMSAFPVSPRYAKMLALSCERHLLPYTVCMVAALSVQQVLEEAHKNSANSRTRRQWAGAGHSLLLGDPMVLLRAVGAAEYAGAGGKLEEFCQQNGLRPKAISEVRKLRLQLTTEINLNLPTLNLAVDPLMAPPTDEQARQLRQLVLAGSADRVAHSVDPAEIKTAQDKRELRHAYRVGDMEDLVTMHDSSVLRKARPEWAVCQEVFETTRLLMRTVTAIEPAWLPVYAPTLCRLSEPLDQPPPRYDVAAGKMYCHVTGTFGKAAWQLPVMEVEFPGGGLDRYKWFARFLLEGSVCPKLLRYTASLVSTPATMVKSWANLQPRTTILLNALTSQQVDSREKLQAAWQADALYLLVEYQKWLPESAHNEVALLWPPV